MWTRQNPVWSDVVMMHGHHIAGAFSQLICVERVSSLNFSTSKVLVCKQQWFSHINTIIVTSKAQYYICMSRRTRTIQIHVILGFLHSWSKIMPFISQVICIIQVHVSFIFKEPQNGFEPKWGLCSCTWPIL